MSDASVNYYNRVFVYLYVYIWRQVKCLLSVLGDRNTKCVGSGTDVVFVLHLATGWCLRSLKCVCGAVHTLPLSIKSVVILTFLLSFLVIHS